MYRALYRASYRLEPPFVPGFAPLCRGLLSVASDLASPIDRMGARLTAQTSRRKLALVAHRHRPAVRAERNRRILHIPDGQRAPREMRARDSRHRAASAGLFAPAGEPASRGTLRAMRMGCVCSARLQLLPATWNSRACRDICTSCDPIEVTADTDVTGCHGPAHDGCSAAGSRRTASARSGCIGSIMRAPSCAIDHHRSKPSL